MNVADSVRPGNARGAKSEDKPEFKMLNLYGSYETKPDAVTLGRMDTLTRRQYLWGEHLIVSGKYESDMQCQGRFVYMREGSAILTFLSWRDRFEKSADEFLRELEHFLYVLEKGAEYAKR